jgi:hypothetical protein
MTPSFETFASAIAPGSLAIYCVKNGLSGFLMSKLARPKRHRRQVAIGNKAAPPDMQAAVLASIESACFDAVYPGLRGRDVGAIVGGHAPRWWHAFRAPRPAAAAPVVYLYHTWALSVERLMAEPAVREGVHVVVEHGMAESLVYIDLCKQRVVDPHKVFLLSFHEQVSCYLERHGIEPTIRSYPFPHAAPLASGVDPAVAERALFAIQPLADTGIIDADDCRSVIRAFLARRPRRHYLIKPHPRQGAVTVAIVAEEMRRAGCGCEVLPADGAIVETEFPRYRCGEIATFYSTAAMLAGKLHSVPFYTAVPELLSVAKVRKQIQIEMIRMIADLFEEQAPAEAG